MRARVGLVMLIVLGLSPTGTGGQQPDPDSVTVERWQIGLTVESPGTCTGILATVPVPMDWPEQRIREVAREVSPQVASIRERTLDGGVRQLLISIPRLNAGQTASALLTLEVWKRTLLTPRETDALKAPTEADRELRRYLGRSPMIETTDREIQRIVREIVVDQPSDWASALAIYNWVRENVRYEFDVELKGALTALRAGQGDCEELTSLFVAFCRVNDIPARSVWIPGHCYPEFYLEDAAGQGHWFPCQAAGTFQFGELTETRPILQKGDRFQVPGEHGDKRYVSETFRARDATVNPRVQFIRKKLDAAPGSSENAEAKYP